MNDIDVLDQLRKADPAVGVDRDADSTTGQRIYQRSLLRAGSAWDTQPSRQGRARENLAPARAPRRRLVLVAAVVVIAILIAIAPALTSHTPAYAIRQLPNGKIEVDWSVNSFRPNANAIAADLRQFGIDVQITTRPASPSAVGVVLFDYLSAGVEEHGTPPGLEYGKDSSTWLIDPKVFNRPVWISVNVPAAPGERYLYSNSVFMPGEALAGLQCTLGEPLRAADVAARLSDLGLTPDWVVIDPASVTPAGSYTEHHVSKVPDGVIYYGYSLDAATVQLEVAPDGLPLSELPNAGPLSDAPCHA